MKFPEAQKKVIEYLKSSDFANREDAQDTVKSLPTLVKIIEEGFITENSQEGSCENGYNKDSKKFYRIEERSYLTGFMKRDAAYAFVNRFNAETDKVAFIIQSEPSEAYHKLFLQGDPNAISKIPVTIQGSATTKSGIHTLVPATTLKLVLPTKILHHIKQSVHLNKTEAVEFVACMDPVYCRKAISAKGLFQDVLKTLKKL